MGKACDKWIFFLQQNFLFNKTIICFKILLSISIPAYHYVRLSYLSLFRMLPQGVSPMKISLFEETGTARSIA